MAAGTRKRENVEGIKIMIEFNPKIQVGDIFMSALFIAEVAEGNGLELEELVCKSANI
jgi:hypothetical protein